MKFLFLMTLYFSFHKTIIGQVLTNNCLSPQDYSCLFPAETLPFYPGGELELDRFILKNIVYSKKYIEVGVKGKVNIGFSILKDGSVTDIHILSSSHPCLSDEVERVIKKMPKWSEYAGVKQKIKFTILINFQSNYD